MAISHSRPPTTRIDTHVDGQMYGGQYTVLRGTLVVTVDGGESVAVALGDSKPEPVARRLLRELVERRQ